MLRQKGIIAKREDRVLKADAYLFHPGRRWNTPYTENRIRQIFQHYINKAGLQQVYGKDTCGRNLRMFTVHSPSPLSHNGLRGGQGRAPADRAKAGGPSQPQDHLRVPVRLHREDGPGLRRGPQNRPLSPGHRQPTPASPELSLFRESASTLLCGRFQNWGTRTKPLRGSQEPMRRLRVAFPWVRGTPPGQASRRSMSGSLGPWEQGYSPRRSRILITDHICPDSLDCSPEDARCECPFSITHDGKGVPCRSYGTG